MRPPLLVFEIVPGTLPMHIPTKVLNVAYSHGVTYTVYALLCISDSFILPARLLDSKEASGAMMDGKMEEHLHEKGSWSAIDENCSIACINDLWTDGPHICMCTACDLTIVSILLTILLTIFSISAGLYQTKL